MIIDLLKSNPQGMTLQMIERLCGKDKAKQPLPLRFL